MKILKPGKLPENKTETPAPAWWLGKVAECNRCHVRITLTASDAPANLDAFSLRCPTVGCNNYIQIRPVCDRSGRII